MKKFMVRVYGRNFHLAYSAPQGDSVEVTGFYTTRFVCAADPTDAEFEAMATIRADAALRAALRNPRTDPPIMVAEHIEEVSSFPTTPPGTGYTFFTGRGAGRPRKITLAAFPDDAPADIREAASRRYGPPAEEARPNRHPRQKGHSGA